MAVNDQFRRTSEVTMVLADRDRRIVQLVGRYGQVGAGQIAALIFDNSNPTPMYRALKRLVDRGYLIRLERRTVGGARGGSGQYIYSLGKKGHYLLMTGKYTPVRAIRYHTLAI